jgi:hypothetical protein
MNSCAFVTALREGGVSRSVSVKNDPGDARLGHAVATRQGFEIEPVHTPVRRHSANQLLKERYAWRGYHSVALPDGLSGSHFSLSATRDGKTIGTMTVGFENPYTLSCEDAFAHEVHAFRVSGRRLCEFTRLAVESGTGTQAVLAALFHVAYIVAHRLRGMDTLLMEVNPRHVRYYERMLGAHVAGSVRTNTKVNAPAVLLSIEFAYVKAQIERCAWRAEVAQNERSLYALAFTEQEEDGIVARLKAPPSERADKRPPFSFRLPTWRTRSLLES